MFSVGTYGRYYKNIRFPLEPTPHAAKIYVSVGTYAKRYKTTFSVRSQTLHKYVFSVGTDAKRHKNPFDILDIVECIAEEKKNDNIQYVLLRSASKSHAEFEFDLVQVSPHLLELLAERFYGFETNTKNDQNIIRKY